MPNQRLTEDYSAIFIGSFILVLSLITFLLFPMIAGDEASIVSEFLNQSVRKLNTWEVNPLSALQKGNVGVMNYFLGLASLFIVFSMLFGLFLKSMGEKVRIFIKGFAIVFLLGIVAYLLASQVQFKSVGLGYALWAIAIGMFISNTFGIPDWLRSSLKHELFIKTGLVLLGAEVLFGKVLAIGLPGIFVAWVVTPIVLISTFWFGQKILKIGSKTLNITISADMSVCGVSAAIATAAACKAKKEELTTAIGLSMVFTSVMMVALPALIKALGMPVETDWLKIHNSGLRIGKICKD